MNSLDQEVIKLQKKGWILLNATDNTAQLRKLKRGFSCLPNIFFSIIGLIGLALFVNDTDFIPGIILFVLGILIPIVYFIAFVLQRGRLIVLTIDAQGKIKTAKKII